MKNPIDDAKQKFNEARRTTSPLTLDLNGDGVQTIDHESGAYFDHDGDGFAEQTGWASREDGLLARDLDGNGQIDTGRELFGNHTQLANGQNAGNGFEALSELDGNQDGKIDAADSAYATLQVWQDSNGDGISSAAELHTLTEADVQSISTAYSTDTTANDPQGNEHRQIGTFTTTTGATRAAEDVWFQVDKTYTIAAEWLDVPADIAVLPDLAGYGNVYDLHQAMARDTTGELKNLVVQFMAETTQAGREMLFEQIFLKWTGANIYPENSRGEYFDGQHLYAIESILGEKFLGVLGAPNPNEGSALILRDVYTQLYESSFSSLMAQTHLKGLYDAIVYTYDETTQTISGDLGAAAGMLTTMIQADRNNGLGALEYFTRSLRGMDVVTMMNIGQFRQALSSIGADVELALDSGLFGHGESAWTSALYGTEADDILIVGNGDSSLSGGIGNDVLKGGLGNDQLFGGAGNDALNGGGGDDVYFFGRGQGSDAINDAGGEGDTIRLKENILPDAVRLYQHGDDLALVLDDSSSQIWVKGHFNPDNQHKIDQIVFKDAAWDAATIALKIQMEGARNSMSGTATDDAFMVDNLGDTITEAANQGTDTVNSWVSYTLPSNVENLTLTGALNINGTGNSLSNVLRGNSGNNVLDGMGGSDAYFGGAGDDTYIVYGGTVVEQAGEGNDTVIYGGSDNSYHLYDNFENLAFNSTSQLVSYAYGNDLDNTITTSRNGTNNEFDGGKGADTMIAAGGTFYVDNVGDRVVASDGLRTHVRSRIDWTLDAGQARLTLEDDTVGYASARRGTGNAGNNLLTGNAADNQLFGMDGNDTLNGAGGMDVLTGGRGDDTYFLSGADSIVELAGEGLDQVFSTADFVLPDNVENLTLSGASGIGSPRASRGVGNSLDNTIIGNDYANTIEGRAGNDTLIDNAGGGDTYVFSRGDGQDTVEDQDAAGGTKDELLFTGDIAADELLFSRMGDDLVVKFVGSDDQVTVRKHFVAGGEGAVPNSRVEQVQLADGTLLSAADIDIRIANHNANAISENADVILGGAGNDVIDALGGGDAVSGGAGDDTLRGGAGDDQLSGNTGNDALQGGDGNDTLNGGSGDDIYDGGAGDDTFMSGAGADTYLLGRNGGNDVVSLDPAPDGAVDTVLVAADIAPSQVLLRNSNDGLQGLIISVAGETTQIDLKYFFAMENPSSNPVQLKFADGTIWTAAMLVSAASAIAGTDGADTLTGTESGEQISGLKGNDILNGLGGNDTLDGGEGADTLSGGAGDDTYLVDNAGDIVNELSKSGLDTVESSISCKLAANIENLRLTGAAAIDATGNSLANTLVGNSANNTLSGGAGADAMSGGAGNDTYVVDNAADVVTEKASDGVDLVQSSVSYTLDANLENLTLTGASATNGTGNALDNALTGNSAANTLTGGAGNDRLDGKAGADKMLGGTGNDTYVADKTTDVITENADEGTDNVEASVSFTLGANVENLTITGTTAINGTGNALDNVLTGNSAANSLTGAAGNDVLDGFGGADTLTGGAGNDAYIMGRGYGADTAVENDATAGNADFAQFLTGVSADQIWFRRVGNNLEASIIGTTDKLVVKDWYLGAANHVEQFRTTDGAKILLDSNVQNMVNAMASFAPPAAGQTTLPSAYQTALSPVIAVNWQ